MHKVEEFSRSVPSGDWWEHLKMAGLGLKAALTPRSQQLSPALGLD